MIQQHSLILDDDPIHNQTSTEIIPDNEYGNGTPYWFIFFYLFKLESVPLLEG